MSSINITFHHNAEEDNSHTTGDRRIMHCRSGPSDLQSNNSISVPDGALSRRRNTPSISISIPLPHTSEQTPSSRNETMKDSKKSNYNTPKSETSCLRTTAGVILRSGIVVTIGYIALVTYIGFA